MKFKIADAPINVMDGIDKYPRLSLVVAGIIFGFSMSGLVAGDWPRVGIGILMLVVSVVLAYFAGKPK